MSRLCIYLFQLRKRVNRLQGLQKVPTLKKRDLSEHGNQNIVIEKDTKKGMMMKMSIIIPNY